MVRVVVGLAVLVDGRFARLKLHLSCQHYLVDNGEACAWRGAGAAQYLRAELWRRKWPTGRRCSRLLRHGQSASQPVNQRANEAKRATIGAP